jgi:ABC-type lipoprotein export system ATPase subunit
MPTNGPRTLKADDYLQELANHSREEWFKSLIDRTISSRAVPDKAFLDITYERFLVEHKLRGNDSGSLPSAPGANPSAPVAIGFTLRSLRHESGVNALEPDATIPFHPKLTVVYGKNGSGKSGFVRILKRIAGSRTQEDVWQNIHSSKTQNRCKAQIQYAIGVSDTLHQWNGESRIKPFDQMSIFDGKCIPLYLNKSLGFSYLPYGLELFQALSVALQGLQQRLANDIQVAEHRKPSVEGHFKENTRIGKFVRTITADTKPEDLKALPAWNARARRTLGDTIKKRNGLQNLDEQLELLQTRLQKLRTLEDALLRVQTDLSFQSIGAYFKLIEQLSQLKKAQAAKKGKTLQDYDIAEMESEQWGSFIAAGEEYLSLIGRDEYPTDDDHCIYCQQKLSKPAQRLIQLYRGLSQEAETSDIEEAEAEVDDAIETLENSDFGEGFPFARQDFRKLLKKRSVTAAYSALTGADALARRLANSLKKRKAQKLKPMRTVAIIADIRKVRASVEGEMNTLEEAQQNTLRRSQELDRAIDELQDAQKLAQHRTSVERYIEIERWVALATQVQTSTLNTKPVTELGKKASRELVSRSFREQFRKEAAGLEAPEVDLEFHGEYGSQMREKNMDGLDAIDRFLSEGEQRAIALADFFAEMSLQHEHPPVIFDDPATSFDHDRKERIAKRIVDESGARQIVVFTHDLMFASYLYAHVEGTDRNLDRNKAAFHDVQSEAKRVGVVTENYYHGSVKFDAYILRVQSKVAELESLTGETKAVGIEKAYGMLRRAIEKAVEEKIFGAVITRWKDQIQMHNADRATLNRAKLDMAKQLHEEFSRYIVAHNQSSKMMQHSSPDVTRLKTDLQRVRELAVR